MQIEFPFVRTELIALHSWPVLNLQEDLNYLKDQWSGALGPLMSSALGLSTGCKVTPPVFSESSFVATPTDSSAKIIKFTAGKFTKSNKVSTIGGEDFVIETVYQLPILTEYTAHPSIHPTALKPGTPVVIMSSGHVRPYYSEKDGPVIGHVHSVTFTNSLKYGQKNIVKVNTKGYSGAKS